MTHESDTPTWTAPRITLLGSARGADAPNKVVCSLETFSGFSGPSGPI